MKYLLFITLSTTTLLFINSCQSQANVDTSIPSATTEMTYDSAFAKKIGADDIGMKHYVMAFLKVGPNRNQDSTTAAEIQKGHMNNIKRLATAGKLILAGPFEDDGEFRGIFIFNTPSLEEAKTLTESDPAVQSGRLVMELHPWYGSAAMMEINSLHKKGSKKSY